MTLVRECGTVCFFFGGGAGIGLLVYVMFLFMFGPKLNGVNLSIKNLLAEILQHLDSKKSLK